MISLCGFGHFLLFYAAQRKSFLVDPVLSGSASPIPSTTRSFPGYDIYSPDDIRKSSPHPDHDHSDHLDYLTLQKLKPKIQLSKSPVSYDDHLKHSDLRKIISLKKTRIKYPYSMMDSPIFTPSSIFQKEDFKRRPERSGHFFLLQTPTLNLCGSLITAMMNIPHWTAIRAI